jgi:rRNA small subunit pseudouridine methyltransferase Nep1
MLTLVLAESALETVPQSLWSQPAIMKYAKKWCKSPRHILLDRSYHHVAMKRLPQAYKRGRPDIVHFSLLEALGSPLNREGRLQVYVHTINDSTITVNSKVRLPRNYSRFVGLMEQLFEMGRVPPKETPLLKLEQKTFPQLIHEIKPTYIMGLTRKGSPKTLEEAVSRLSREEKPAVIIGAFPQGNFSEETINMANETACIDLETLEAWTVTSRIIYEYECAISLPKKRLKQP